MAGDLKRFLFEEKQSLRRYQSNLDDIIEKYNKPFNDNAVDIRTCSVIKGKKFLRSKNPSYFGHSKFTHIKKKDSQRSFFGVDNVSLDYQDSDRHTSGYHSLKTDDESCVSDYSFLNLTYTKEKRHPTGNGTSLNLSGKTVRHCSPSDTFSLAEQNEDVEDTEELLALKETMLSIAADDSDEPSDAETITSSSSFGSDEYEEGFEYLFDSEEEVTKDRPSATSSTSSDTYSPYNRKNATEITGDEVDGEIRLEKPHLYDANTTSQDNKHLYSGRHRNLQDENNSTSPSIINRYYRKRVEANSPGCRTDHEYRPCDVSKDSFQTHNSDALDSFFKSYWTRQQVGNVCIRSDINREVSDLASTEKKRNGDIHNTHCKVNNCQGATNEQILNGGSQFHRSGMKEHPANVNTRKSSMELGEKEKVAQVFNRMASGQGMQRDLLQRTYIMKETRPNSVPDTTGSRQVPGPRTTGTRQVPVPRTTGTRQVSERHTTGTRQVSVPHTTGSRQVSVPHTTGTRQVSVPHTTSTRQVSGRGMKSPQLNSDKFLHSPEQNQYVDQESEKPQEQTPNQHNSMEIYFTKISVPPKLTCDQKHLSNGVSGSGFEEDRMPGMEEVGEETEETPNHYKSTQRKDMHKSAAPPLHCDLKDLSHGISASGFADEQMSVKEKVYRWLSPTNNDISVSDRFKIKAKRRLHMAAPHTLDNTDNALNRGHLNQMGQRKQINWESQFAKPTCYRQDTRTNPESPSSIFSRMKLNSPSTSSYKPSVVRPAKIASPNENKSYFRQSLFSNGQDQDVTEQQNVCAVSHSYAMTSKDFYSPTRLLGTTDDMRLDSQRYRSNKSNDAVALQGTRTKSADYFNKRPAFEAKENVSCSMDSRLTSFDSHQSGEVGCSDQSTHSVWWTASLGGSAVDSRAREEKLNFKAFVLSGKKNENQRSKISATSKMENERETFSNAEASSETFVKYSDEYTFKSQESPEVSDRTCLSKSSYVFRAPARFVSDRQVRENWEQEVSTRSCVMGSPFYGNSPKKVPAKREKRFSCPSKVNPIYTSPRHRDYKRDAFSPVSRKSLVTISSKAKMQSAGIENDSIYHLSNLEEKWKEVNVPVRTRNANTQLIEPKETSLKSITSQRSSSVTSTDFVSNRFVNLKNRIIVNNQMPQNSNCIKKFTQSTPIKQSVMLSMNNTLSTICGKLSDDEDSVDTESDSSDETVLTIT